MTQPLPPHHEHDVKLAETAATAGFLGLFSVTLVLVILRTFFFDWSWWWCLAPLGIALLSSAGVVVCAALFTGRKGKHTGR